MKRIALANWRPASLASLEEGPAFLGSLVLAKKS
jgi:hypothetical protein